MKLNWYESVISIKYGENHVKTLKGYSFKLIPSLGWNWNRYPPAFSKIPSRVLLGLILSFFALLIVLGSNGEIE